MPNKQECTKCGAAAYTECVRCDVIYCQRHLYDPDGSSGGDICGTCWDEIERDS